MTDEEMMLIGLGVLGIAALAMGGGGGGPPEKDPFARGPGLREYMTARSEVSWGGDYEAHGDGYDDPSFGPTQQDLMLAKIHDRLDTAENKFDRGATRTDKMR